jgi:hypothetical protein
MITQLRTQPLLKSLIFFDALTQRLALRLALTLNRKFLKMPPNTRLQTTVTPGTLFGTPRSGVVFTTAICTLELTVSQISRLQDLQRHEGFESPPPSRMSDAMSGAGIGAREGVTP